MARKKRILTKGQLEAKISEYFSRFEKGYMGRGPLEIKTYILDTILLIRLKGILTAAELKMVKSDDGNEARNAIKKVRIALLESARSQLEHDIRSLTRSKVISMHTDLSTATGEKIIVFTLDRFPEVGLEAE